MIVSSFILFVVSKANIQRSVDIDNSTNVYTHDENCNIVFCDLSMGIKGHVKFELTSFTCMIICSYNTKQIHLI